MIFGWTIPLTFDSVHCRRTSTLMRLPGSWWRTSFSTIKVFHMKRAMVTRLNWTNKQCLLRASQVVASVDALVCPIIWRGKEAKDRAQQIPQSHLIPNPCHGSQHNQGSTVCALKGEKTSLCQMIRWKHLSDAFNDQFFSLTLVLCHVCPFNSVKQVTSVCACCNIA